MPDNARLVLAVLSLRSAAASSAIGASTAAIPDRGAVMIF
jgi:hypothetical protein